MNKEVDKKLKVVDFDSSKLCKKGWVLRLLLRNTEVLLLLSPFLNPSRDITGPLIKKLTH